MNVKETLNQILYAYYNINYLANNIKLNKDNIWIIEALKGIVAQEIDAIKNDLKSLDEDSEPPLRWDVPNRTTVQYKFTPAVLVKKGKKHHHGKKR